MYMFTIILIEFILSVCFASSINAARVENASAEYSFLYTDYEQNIFPDVSTHGYLGIMSYPNRLSTTSFPALSMNGVKSTGRTDYVSSSNITALSSTLTGTSMTIELWLQMNQSLSTKTSMLSFTSSSSKSQCHDYFKLYQLPVLNGLVGITIEACTKSDTFLAKLAPIYVPMEFSKVAHLVIVLSYSSFPGFRGTMQYVTDVNYTVNGVFAGSDFMVTAESLEPSKWDPWSKLYLFSDPYATSYWTGQYYYLSIYSYALSMLEILQNYHSKIPYSTPVVTSYTTTIQQEGEVGDHRDTPTYYLSTIPSTELVVIELSGYSFDDTITSPNYNISNDVMTIEIVSPPRYGTLYYYNGSTIVTTPGSAISIPRNSTTGNFPFRYRPRYGAYTTIPLNIQLSHITPYTTITYRAIHGVSGVMSRVDANVSIIIQRVTKPPRVQPSAVTVVSADAASRVLLTGSADTGLVITKAKILSLPKQGSFFSTSTANPSSNLTVGSVVIGAGSISVYYYIGLPSPLPALTDDYDGIIGKDAFTFEVIDSASKFSIPATMNLTIHTTIYAISSTAKPNVVQATCGPVKVYGRDASQYPRYLQLEIIKLPGNGSLYLDASCNANYKITSPQILPTEYSPAQYVASSEGVTLYYMSDDNFFNWPAKDFDGHIINDINSEFFSYRFRTNQSLASETSKQYLRVKNTNHPTTINFTDPHFRIYAFTYSPIPSKPIYAFLENFRLDDPDRGIDPIRVTIDMGEQCYVDLNPDYVNKVWLTLGLCSSTPNFRCEGDGYGDQYSMTFIGQPSDVQNAINGIRVYSTNDLSYKVVNITIYDGETSPCLSSSDLGSSRSSRAGQCHITSTSFTVTVSSYSGYTLGELAFGDAGTATQGWIYFVGYVILLLMCCASIRFVIHKFCSIMRCICFGDEKTGRRGVFSRRNIKDAKRLAAKYVLDVEAPPESQRMSRRNVDDVYATPPRKMKTNDGTGIRTGSTIDTAMTGEGEAYSSPSPRSPDRLLSRQGSPSKKPSPFPLPDILASDKLPEGWKIYRAKNGRVFYYNKNIKTSTWTCPTTSTDGMTHETKEET